MEKTYLIDGYNVIHAAPQLKRTLRDSGIEQARANLLNAVAAFAERHKGRCIVVFDGVAESGVVSPRVEAVFSRDRSADDVIREHAMRERAMRDGSRLVVVSSDLEILATARANMAEIVQSKSFAAQLTLGTHSTGLAPDPGPSAKAAARPHRIAEARERSEKPGAISRDDLDEWKKLFGMTDEE